MHLRLQCVIHAYIHINVLYANYLYKQVLNLKNNVLLIKYIEN